MLIKEAIKLDEVKLYFSDFFDVDEEIIEEFGAVNISLINDLPLFIDPFLLFNSDNGQFCQIHDDIIKYLLFLQEQAELHPILSQGMMKSWYLFSEVKQTWLGFSLDGNSGRGLGADFAKNLHLGLNTIFEDFGKETVPKSPHMEKLCLVSPNVGRDKISDFATNFAKKFLLEYTEAFAKTYLEPEHCKTFSVPKVEFNYNTMSWSPKAYTLPCFNDDYVLLTPKSMLTRDDTFINRSDMIDNLQSIAPSIGDTALRFELDNYFRSILSKKKKKMSKTEKEYAAVSLIRNHPELIDYYLKYKEDNEQEATSVSKQMVQEVQQLFNVQLQELVSLLRGSTIFYKVIPDSLEEARKRVGYLKNVIEDQDGYKIFYLDGKPIKRESDLQIMYRLVWYASEMDVNREVNNGRGPVDYKVCKCSVNPSVKK
ncbi:hypothetical protein CEB3_c33830 [Peptococcaceae bacterium CEB3]|nr:hypothetical protein CEB3_c33830 [Peptococcaceae bacterium CEB3]